MFLRNHCLLLLFCSCLLTWPAVAAEIQVSVDRNPINLNDSFQITFSASEQPDGNPDFAPLQDNFEILNQQRSSNVSWVNGKVSRTEKWIVSAMAKQAGEFLIPSIAFGSDTSKPLKVTIKGAPQSAFHNDEIFLDVQASPEKPYVQSQVLYTLRIYFRVQISESRLSDLEIKDALIEQLGQDTSYRTQIHGVEYGVLERKYAIFPQQSGLFTIAPLTLTAEVVSGRQSRFNGFFNRQFTETRRVSSKALTINVLPVPRSFHGSNWLSAESLELTESWSDKSLQTKVGEPLTRTIRLAAKGTTVGQLPELLGQESHNGLKSYPDQPVLNENKQSDGLIAIREEKVAFIPSRTGDFTLPELKIPWFNTKTQRTEIAHLPSITLHALPASVASSHRSNTSAPSESATTEVEPTIQQGHDAGYWPWVSGVLALGWLSHVLWLYRRRGSVVVEKDSKAGQNIMASNAEIRLKKACAINDSESARQALLAWGHAQFGISNLSALANVCNEPLATEIEHLNRHLYASEVEPWTGQSLWTTFARHNKELQKQPSSEQDSVELEPLFKL